MATQRDMYTVDADGHVMEPADLWLRYIEPEHRERALQIKVDADGLESLYVEGKPMRLLHGIMGALGGIEASDTAAKQAFQTPGARTYADGCPPKLIGFDQCRATPAERIKHCIARVAVIVDQDPG